MTILPQLEQDLFQAARQCLPAANLSDGSDDPRRHGRDRTRRRAGLGRRPAVAATARTLPILLAIVVTVVVAAFALILIHHGRQSQPASPATSVKAARQQLVQMFAVLRRPQSKADLDPELDPGFFSLASIPEQFARRHKPPPAGLERRLAQLGSPKLDQALVRVVPIPAWHAKVGIEPATWRPSPSSRQRSEGLDLELWIGTKRTIPPSSDIGSGPRPTSVDTIRAHGLALADNAPGQNLIDGVILVPDGVARITLRLIRVIHAPLSIDPNQFGTATATVHDNIAAFQLSIPAATSRNTLSGMFGTSAIAETTWFDASGNVIKHTTTNLDVLIKVVGKRAAPPRGSIPHDRRTQFCLQNPHAC